MDFEVISFDLFNTLVYLEGWEVSRKEVLLLTYNSFKDNFPNLKFENFYNVYIKQWNNHLKVKPPFLERNQLYLMDDILNEVLNENEADDIRSISKIAVKTYFDEILNYIKLYPYVEKLLATLSKKYPLVLLSDHSYAQNGYDVLNKFNLTKYFSKIVFSDEIGYRKPSKIIFDYAFKDFSISDHNKILHIGDKFELDVEGIIQYGGRAIWIKVDNNDFNPGSFLEEKKIICITNSLEEISNLFLKT